MRESGQTQTFQIEHLLQSYGEVIASRRAQELPARDTRFDRRSMLAGFLAVFIFAPGCATATVFLMQTEKSLPEASHPQPASKPNRMPLSHWKAEAPVVVAAYAEHVAPASGDIADLEPLAIRGMLEAQTFAEVNETPAPEVAVVAPVQPKRRRAAPRTKPVNFVADVAVPETAPPSFLEKLFALRTL
jgi:hypothetical protein